LTIQQKAYIALGGNLGEVKANFDAACVMLKATCTIIKKSKLYQTPAIGPLMQGKPQPDYLNAVLYISTSLSASALLQELHRIEAKHHRKRLEHWGARTLDLDLLHYEGLVCKRPDLTLPHPRLHERLFVLQPWADIHPNWKHPLSGDSVTIMIKALTTGENSLFKGQPWVGI